MSSKSHHWFKSQSNLAGWGGICQVVEFHGEGSAIKAATQSSFNRICQAWKTLVFVAVFILLTLISYRNIPIQLGILWTLKGLHRRRFHRKIFYLQMRFFHLRDCSLICMFCNIYLILEVNIYIIMFKSQPLQVFNLAQSKLGTWLYFLVILE